MCRPGTAGPGCRTCTAGTFSPGGDAAATTCMPCPSNATSVIAGAVTCSGTYTDAHRCSWRACIFKDRQLLSSSPVQALHSAQDLQAYLIPHSAEQLVRFNAIPLTVCRPGFGGPGCVACDLGKFSPGGNVMVATPPCATCPAKATTLMPGGSACSGMLTHMADHADRPERAYNREGFKRNIHSMDFACEEAT